MVLALKTVWNVMDLLLVCSQIHLVRHLEAVSRNHRVICEKNSQNWKLLRTYCLDKLNLCSNILICVSTAICRIIHLMVRITNQYLGVIVQNIVSQYWWQWFTDVVVFSNHIIFRYDCTKSNVSYRFFTL